MISIDDRQMLFISGRNLHLQQLDKGTSVVRNTECVLTMMVPEVFIPCSRMATRVKTSMRGPYSSPAIFCKQEVDCQRVTTEPGPILRSEVRWQEVKGRTWGKLIMRTGIKDSMSL